MTRPEMPDVSLALSIVQWEDFYNWNQALQVRKYKIKTDKRRKCEAVNLVLGNFFFGFHSISRHLLKLIYSAVFLNGQKVRIKK